MNEFDENTNYKKRDSSQAKLESLARAREGKIQKKNNIEETIISIDSNVNNIKEDINLINGSILSLKEDIVKNTDHITEDFKINIDNKHNNLESIINTLKNSRLESDMDIDKKFNYLKPSYLTINNILLPLTLLPVAGSSYLIYKYVKKNFLNYKIKPITENKLINKQDNNKLINRDIFGKKW